MLVTKYYSSSSTTVQGGVLLVASCTSLNKNAKALTFQIPLTVVQPLRRLDDDKFSASALWEDEAFYC
jgi:hypothetical protein